MQAPTPYQLLGEDGIRQLVNAFYEVMDEQPQADTIRQMHTANLELIKEKLFEYLCGWMGGPPMYSDKYGTVCLTDPHKPYPIGPDERDQWLDCMDKALLRVNASEELTSMLQGPIYQIADTVRNRETSEPVEVPVGQIPLTNL
ncbi:MAG: hemoglobin [Oceanicoccus sp.]|jgi:hemoglobin